MSAGRSLMNIIMLVSTSLMSGLAAEVDDERGPPRPPVIG
jgi:hypothetical protein